MDQDAPRPLPVVPPPLQGEALASWLGRVAAEYQVSVATLLSHVKLPVQPNRWLSLPALPDSALQILSHRLRMPLALMRAMNASPFSLGSEAQLAFCPRCMNEDVAQARPLHWRCDWLDAFNVCCQLHDVALAPVGTATLGRCGNWLHAVTHPQHLLDVPAAKLDPAQARHYASARTLQEALGITYRSARRLAVYGVEYASELRTIAMDLLDLLLGRFRVAKDPQEPSVLMNIVQLRDEPLPLAELIIYPVWTRTRLVTRVRSLTCRTYALSITNTLLTHTAHLAVSSENLRLKSDCVLRTTWLWALMPNHVHAMFIARSRAWPREYVQRCWPELMEQPTGGHLPPRAVLERRHQNLMRLKRAGLAPRTINSGQNTTAQDPCAGATIFEGLRQGGPDQTQSEAYQSRILA